MTPGREFYLWQVPSFTARIDLKLVDNLNRTLADARLKQDEERGGILFGHTIAPDQIEISDFELMPSQHHRGPIYSLGLREQYSFAKRVAGLRKKSGRNPIGFFRTHIRRGLFLDQDDFSLMQEAFAGPPHVALLIRPIEPGPSNAGIFLWEDGDIDRRQPQLVFPFDSETLRMQGPVESTVSPAISQPAPVTAAERRPHTPREPLRIPAIPPRWIAWGATAGVGALALSAALPHIHVKPQEPRAVVIPIVGKAATSQQPQAEAAPPAPEATQMAAAEPEPVLVEIPKPDEGGNRAEPAPRAFTAPISIAAPKPEPKQIAAVTPPPITVPTSTAAPVPIPEPALPAPPRMVAAMRPEPMAPTPVRVRHEPAVRVAVSVETKESSELKRVVSHVPLFGRTVHAEGGSGFIPARPSRDLEPSVPAYLASNLSGNLAVDVRLSIDKHGAVTNTQVLQGAGTEFASLATNSAASTAWEPAHDGDRNVSSDVIVHYRFSGSGVTPASGAQQ